MLDEKTQGSLAMTLVPVVDGLNLGQDREPGVPSRRARLTPLPEAGVTPLGVGLHDFIAQQFARPEGICGRMAAAVMGMINHLPNMRAIELLDIAERDDVLEMGFGPGWALKRMAKLARAGTIIGVDRSATMFCQAEARNRAAMEDGQVRLIQGTFEQLPLESATVDKILAVNVLYFCSPTGTALREARRVLRRGGTMSIYVTDCSSMRRLQFIGPETQQTFDRRGLEDFLGDSAFGSDQIDIYAIRLPFGFRGFVARIRKV